MVLSHLLWAFFHFRGLLVSHSQEDGLKAFFCYSVSCCRWWNAAYQKTPSLIQLQLNVCQEEAIQHAKRASPSAWPTLTTTVKRSDSGQKDLSSLPVGIILYPCQRASAMPLGYLGSRAHKRSWAEFLTKFSHSPKCGEVVLPCSLQTSSHKSSLQRLAQFTFSEPKKTEANIPPYSWNQQLIWLTIYGVAGMLEEAGLSSLSLGENTFTWAFTLSASLLWSNYTPSI